MSNVFISTAMESFGVIALDEVPTSPGKPSLVEAIELSEVDNLLAITKFQVRIVLQ